MEKYSKFNFITAGWKYNEYCIKKRPKDIFYWLSRNKQTGGKLSHFRKIEPIFLFGSLPKKVRYDLDYFDFNSDRLDGLRDLHTCPKPVKFVESAIKVNAKAIWMQDGVINEKAFEAAKNAGLSVVMNDCILRRHMEMDRDLQ